MYRGGRSEGSSASPMPRLPRPSQAYVRLRKRTMLRTRGSSSNVVAVTAAPGTTVAAAPAGKEASARSEETRKGTTARSPAEPAISKTGNGTLAPAPAGGSAASPLDRNALASMGAALDFIVSPEPVIGKGSVAGKASVEESLEPWRVVETPPPPPISSTDALPRATVVSPELVQEALEEGAYMLPRRRWDQPSDAPLLRGPAYLEDGKKVPAVGGPLCTLFAAQCFELLGDHVAGATALLLQKGDLVPPREAKFVFTIYFACPRPSRGQPYIALLLHFYSKTSVEDVPAASGDLLRELWSGNAENAISRFKVLAALRSGPHLVRAVLAWLGLDDTRPMLLCRQVHASLNRATLPHLNGGRGASSGGMPSHYDHVEIAFDLAASPLCNQIMRYAWPSLSSVDVSMTFVLEGRAEDELPERHLSTFAINALEQTELTAQPPSWPSSEADVAAIPGEAIGPRTSGRGSDVVGSWQLTRVIVTEEKERAANGGGEAAPRKLTQIRSLGGRALNWTRSRGSAEDIS